MARRARQIGRVTSIPSCTVCGLHHQDDVLQQEICKSFALLREALLPEFGALITALPSVQVGPLLDRFKGSRTPEQLSEFLLQLRETEDVRRKLEPSRRLNGIISQLELTLIASEYPSFDHLQADFARRLPMLVGKRRLGIHIRECSRATNAQVLAQILGDIVHDLRTSPHYYTRVTAIVMLAQTLRFSASHPEQPPPEAAAQSGPCHLIPLAEGA